MSTVTATLSAVGETSAFSVADGDSITYSAVLDEGGTTFDAVVKLYRGVGAGAAWEPVATLTGEGSGTFVCEHGGGASRLYKLACTVFGETSDPIVITLADVADARDPVSLMTATEDGVTLDGKFTATDEIRTGGVVGDDNVRVLLRGPAGNVLICRCAAADIPADDTAGFAKGCLLIATNGTDHTNTVFFNIGDETECNFNAATIAADA